MIGVGHGVYFWEGDPLRAQELAIAKTQQKGSSIIDPFILGAVLDLVFCLSLLRRSDVSIVKEGYDYLKMIYGFNNEELPVNSGGDDRPFN